MSRLPNHVEEGRERLEGALGSLAHARVYLRLAHDRAVFAAAIGPANLLDPVVEDLAEAEQLITRAQETLTGRTVRPIAPARIGV